MKKIMIMLCLGLIFQEQGGVEASSRSRAPSDGSGTASSAQNPSRARSASEGSAVECATVQACRAQYDPMFQGCATHKRKDGSVNGGAVNDAFKYSSEIRNKEPYPACCSDDVSKIAWHRERINFLRKECDPAQKAEQARLERERVAAEQAQEARDEEKKRFIKSETKTCIENSGEGADFCKQVAAQKARVKYSGS